MGGGELRCNAGMAVCVCGGGGRGFCETLRNTSVYVVFKTITSSLLEMTRGGLKGAARRQCRQGGLRDTLEYKLVEVRDGKNAGVQEFSRGYWLDDDLTTGYPRRAV